MSDRYHILSHTLPAHHVDNMLGRIVVDTRDPLHRFVPDTDSETERRFHPVDIVPDISDQPVQYDDLSKILDAAHNTEARLRLDKILDAHARRTTSKNVKVTAAIVVRRDMINVGGKLNQLMRDREYRSQVKKLLADTPGKKLSMVTGVMTCKDTVVTLDNKAERGAGAGLRVPVGEAIGGPSLGDPEARIEHSRNDGNAVESKIREEVIFALAYDEVKLESYIKRKCWFSSSQPQRRNADVVLGNKMLGNGLDLYFGDNDDLDEDTDDDNEKGLNGKGRSGSLQFTFC